MKALTKYLVTGDEYSLNVILEDKKDADKLKYRCISHLLIYPHLIGYMNEYLNHKFEFNQFDNEKWFRTIRRICSTWGISDNNQLYFAKWEKSEYDEFCKILDKYCDILNLESLNTKDKGVFFNFYESGILNDEHMNLINQTISGQESRKDKLTKGTPSATNNVFHQIQKQSVQNNTVSKYRTITDLHPRMQEICNNVTSYIKSARTHCKNCPLYGKSPVVLDSNMTQPGQADIIVYGLNPTPKDVENGIPFSNDASLLFRQYMAPLIQKYNLKYIYLNKILCATDTEKDIPKINQTFKHCSDIIGQIEKSFPHRIKIVLGEKTAKSFGIKGTMKQLNGEFIDNRIFIMYSPSSIQYNKNNLAKFEEAIDKLYGILEEEIEHRNEQQRQTEFGDDIRIDPSKIITRITNDLTLFDIQTLNEKIIYIFKNGKNQKRYVIENIKIPIYIKNGTYSQCLNVDSNMDGVCYVTAKQRQYLNKTLFSAAQKQLKV